MIWPGWPCKWGNGKWPTSGDVAKYQLFSQAKPTQELSWGVCSQRFRICIKSPKYCTLTVLMKVELPSCLSLSDVHVVIIVAKHWIDWDVFGTICLYLHSPVDEQGVQWKFVSFHVTLVGFPWTKYANLYIGKIEKNVTSCSEVYGGIITVPASLLVNRPNLLCDFFSLWTLVNWVFMRTFVHQVSSYEQIKS